MMPSDRSSVLDEIFQRFVTAGLSEEDVQAARREAMQLEQGFQVVIDGIKAISADREGRERLRIELARRQNG